jgi:hypothetical protein
MGVEPTQDLIGPDAVLKTAEAAGPLPSPRLRFWGVSADGSRCLGRREAVQEVVRKCEAGIPGDIPGAEGRVAGCPPDSSDKS